MICQVRTKFEKCCKRGGFKKEPPKEEVDNVVHYNNEQISVQPDQINIVLDGLKVAGKEQDKLEEHRKKLKDAETKKNSEGKSLDF